VPSFVREQLNSLEHQLKRHLRPQYSIRFAEICEKRHKALWKTTIKLFVFVYEKVPFSGLNERIKE
jgi:hypothetical protein